MADNITKTALVLSIIAILTAAGVPIGSQMLAGNEAILDNYYVCEFIEDSATGNLEIFYFDRLSSSEQRGYPFEGTTKGYTDCKNSDGVRAEWLQLAIYAEDLSVNPHSLLSSYVSPTTTTSIPGGTPPPMQGTKCWLCGQSCRRCD